MNGVETSPALRVYESEQAWEDATADFTVTPPKNGTKTIEFRLFDEKRQLIKVGDKIKFLKETAKILQKIDSKIEQEIYLDKIKWRKNGKNRLFSE